MQKYNGTAVLCFCLRGLFAPATLAQNSGPTYTTIDVPGATGTFGLCVNTAGTVAGYYIGAEGAYHGFVRAADGSITTFDPPGGGRFTIAEAINAAGAITGYYVNASGANEGLCALPAAASRRSKLRAQAVANTRALSPRHQHRWSSRGILH